MGSRLLEFPNIGDWMDVIATATITLTYLAGLRGISMDFRIQQHRIQQLTSRLNLMVVLVLGLLTSNLMLSGLSWYALLHQRVEVTPFMSGSAYQKSDATVDSRYLMLMSENFLY